MNTQKGIFLDTGDLADISKYHRLGIVRGVTTGHHEPDDSLEARDCRRVDRD
jgi:hypothetical protein